MKRIVRNMTNIFIIICLITINLYIPDVDAKEATTLRQMKQQLSDFKKNYEDNKLSQQLTKEEEDRTKQNIKNIEKTISNTQDEIYELKQEIERLNEDIVSKEKEIETILSFYQISNGESVYLEYAFGAKDFTDFIYRVAVSEQLTSYNNLLVNQYKKDIEDSKRKTVELTDKIAELEKQQINLQLELKKIATKLDELYDDSLSIEESIAVIESRIKSYEEIGCTLDEDLDACVKNKLIKDDGFYRPLEQGHVTSFPGYRCIKIGGKETCSTHRGLDMSNYGAASTDYKVYPIANGKVVYMDINYRCGGRRVYIEHNVNGKLYLSGYWHLRSISVKVGQTVTRVDPIGIMGGTESWDECTNGAHLHLEMSDASLDIDYLTKHKLSVVDAARTGLLNPRDYLNLPSRTKAYVHWTNRYN